MRVVIKNFQSILSAKMELEGFTVITGRSNLGKTALIRAVGAAWFGLPGDHFIREGTSQCGVGVSEGSNFTIKWYKVKNGQTIPGRETALEINGVKHTKLGRDHSVLTEPLGVREIKTSNNLRSRPQIAMQHDPIFLLQESETTSAEILRMLGRADVVSEAQRKARKDFKELETKLKIRKEDQTVAQKAKEELDFVGGLRSLLVSLKEDIKEAIRSGKSRVKRKETLGRYRKLRTFQEVPQIPKMEKTIPQIELSQKIGRWRELTTQEVPEKPVLESTETLEKKRIKLINFIALSSNEIESERTLVEIDIQTLEREKKELEALLANCPTCGQSFDGNHC